LQIQTDREALIRGVVERYFRAIASADEESWVALHAPEAVSFAPVGSAPLETTEQRRRFVRGLCAAFDDVALVPDRIWVAPDGAAVKWTARATSRSGRDVVFDGVDVFEIDDGGRISTVWSYWEPEKLVNSIEM
jgi:steroid delta-isomerase